VLAASHALHAQFPLFQLEDLLNPALEGVLEAGLFLPLSKERRAERTNQHDVLCLPHAQG
jgi:hypothetical protein